MAKPRAPRPRKRQINRRISDQFDAYPDVRAGLRYCEDVVAGQIPAGQWIILACERQLRDLTRKRSWPYYFDAWEAERVSGILQLFPHIKGVDFAGKPGLSEPWQKFIDTTAFGWRQKDGDFRRFHEVYECVARKNGKSFKGAGRGLYALTLDGEAGPEVYAGNISEDEANKIWRPAWYMAKKSPEFRKDCGVDVMAQSIVTAHDGGKFERLIGQPADGDSPSFVLIDEYHQHKTDHLYETMKTGAGARPNWMIWIMTTAGNTIGGPCFDYQQDMQSILSGAVKDEEKFPVIYAADEGDDWEDPAVLAKANPNMGVSVDAKFLLARQAEAARTPRALAGFKTKHLNLWVGARSAYLNMAKWRRCQNSQQRIEDYRGKRCIGIIDLASKIDIAAYMKIFPELRDDGIHYTVFGEYYVPEEAVHEDLNKKYKGWHTEGLLNVHDGEEIDFSFIQADVERDLALYQIEEIAYDPWRAVMLAQALSKCGIEMVEYHNLVKNMSEPMKELETAVNSKRLHHDGNPILTWMASNVTAHEDANQNVFPRKEGHRKLNKIDGIVASIMGIGRLMYRDDLGDVDDFIDGMIVA